MCNSCLAFYLAQLVISLKKSPAYVHTFLIDEYGHAAAEEIMFHIDERIASATWTETKTRTLNPKRLCKCEEPK